jgi:hypothetical protein
MADDQRPDLHAELLANVKRDFDDLTALLEQVSGHWEYEDFVYRFWCQSFEVFAIQDATGGWAPLYGRSPCRLLAGWMLHTDRRGRHRQGVQLRGQPALA